MRKFAQGAGSALLAFAGADSLTNGAAAAAGGSPPVLDFSSVAGMTQSLLAGGMSGPFQIVAAALLFLTAGRCVARFIGLVVVAAVLVLHTQGVTFENAWAFFENFAERLAAATSAFQTADVG